MSKKKTVIFAFITMLLWGSLFPVVKLGYKEFGLNTSFIPDLIFFAGIRFVVCGCLLCTYNGIKKTYKVDNGKKYLTIVLIGVFSITLHYACTYIGLSMTDSSKTALLKQLGVIFFICFSFIFIKEDKFSAFKLFSAILGVIGIVILNFDSVRFSFGIGELLIIGASVCTVVSNILCKKYAKGINPLFVTGGSELAGGLILLIIGVSLGGALRVLSVGGLLISLYIVFATVVSYSLWYKTVQQNNLSYLFIIKLSEPLFAAVIGAIILGENIFKWQYAVSFLCIIIAVFVSNFKIKVRHKKIKEVGSLQSVQIMENERR